MSAHAGPNLSENNLILSIDSGNKRSYSPNVHPRALDIFGWAERGGFRADISRDSIFSPVGSTPVRVVPNLEGSGGYFQTYNTLADNLAPAVAGETWTFSFWAKANKTINGSSYIFEANAAGAYIQAPNKGYTFTTEWQRYEHTYTFINPLATSIQVRLDWVGDTTAIYWFDGFQVERHTSATRFNSSNFGTGLNNLVGENNVNLTLGKPNFDGNQIILNATQGFFTTGLENILSLWSDPFSLEMWMYVPSSATWSNGNRSMMIARGSTDGSHGLARTGNNNQMSMYIRSNTGIVEALATITRDAWWHVVGVWDGIRTSSIYTNGVFRNSSTLASTPTPSNMDTGNFSLLRSVATLANAVGSNYDGNFTIINIYNKPLSAAEVNQNFNATRGRHGL
jgi:hypothetical protein